MFDRWVWLTPLTFRIVEERAIVRIGVRDRIVTIEVQRARVATIVSIAQQVSTTQTGARRFYQLSQRKREQS